MMYINNNSLLKLMNEIDEDINRLLIKLEQQYEEINNLQQENKTLKDNYQMILKQINLYISELESLKHTNT